MKFLGYGAGSHPIAEAASRRLLSLPIYPELTPASVRVVSTAVHDFFEPSPQGPGVEKTRDGSDTP